MTENSNKADFEKYIIHQLKMSPGADGYPERQEAFSAAVDNIAALWTENRKNRTTWSSEFQEKVSELLRTPGNKSSFQIYLSNFDLYAHRSMTDGFYRSCSMRSKIQVIVEEFVNFADLVPEEDADHLEYIDDLYKDFADNIPPIPHDEIPSWVPESHWWWRVPTRHDMSREEIEERLYDYHPEDWNPDH
ncbi:hypothetical protein [Nocardiopsis alba]|uniref:hypothetical protein n=1 Tax=Nocardiopsis alba TaxID=53437 RepID=UPI0035D609CF